jgi:2-dehydropantoate 2-reductase
MRIAIIGAGAVGGVLAARLTSAGERVTLVGRDDQVRTVTERGLSVRGQAGVETVAVRAVTRLDSGHDVVILATKTQDLTEAVEHHRAEFGRCLLLSTQNGVRADAVLAEYFDRGRLMSSIVMFGATYTKPGEVTLNFPGGLIVGRPFARSESGDDAEIRAVAVVLGRAFDVTLESNITAMKHLKLFVNFNNCLPGLIGEPMQTTFADRDLCRLSVMLLQEGVATVRAAGIELGSLPSFPRERIEALVTLPVERAAEVLGKTLTGLSQEPLYGSILQSILRGKKSEVDFLNGEIVRIAQQCGLHAPLNEKVVALLHGVEESGRFMSPEQVKHAFELS